MCHFFTRTPLRAPGDCHWKGGKTFLDKAENTTCLINFFFNWYSDLYQKWQYIGIFHPLRIFWCLKLRGQSIRFCTASHSHGTPTRNLHFLCAFCSPLSFFEMISEQHNYATRSASLQHLNPDAFRINIRKFCPTILGCYYWNDIPLSIRNKPTRKLF